MNLLSLKSMYQSHRDLLWLMQCAPVIKHIKAANTITVDNVYVVACEVILQQRDVNVIRLYEDDRKTVLFVFLEVMLCEVLKKEEYAGLLDKYGYQCNELSLCLLNLSKRFYEYKQKLHDFPHELGVFLEYPRYDIEQFILQKGANCLYEGYWKVYHNLNQACKMFELYDQAKQEIFLEYQKKSGCVS